MNKRELTSEQKHECARLKELFESKKAVLKIGQQELADQLEISQGAVSHYLNGRNALNLEAAVGFAKVLRVPISAFSERLAKDLDFAVHVAEEPSTYAINAGKVPVLTWITATKWCDAPDTFLSSDADEWLECPFPHSGRSFYLKVIGDSMAPEYCEGEYILVDPEIVPSHGDDVVLRSPAGMKAFKRLQITPEGTYLLALNPDHPNRKIEIPPDTEICGVVTSSLKKRR
jgi:SOS-response transcriptional repressor LexA